MNKFAELMKQRSSAELIEITTTLRDVFKNDAVTAAYKELQSRNISEEQFSELKTEFEIKEKQQEKIKAENLLRESEERFRKIFTEGPLGMFVASAGFRIKQVNETFCKMLGYEAEELLQLTLNDIALPMQMIRDADALKKVSRGDIKLFRSEKQYVKKDGNIFWGNLTVSALCDDKGHFLNYLCMVEDITERKNSEKIILKNKQFLDNLIESMSDGLSVLNKDGVRIMVNQAFCDMTGYSREELLYSPPPFPFWAPERIDEVKKAFTEMQYGIMQEQEFLFMRKSGERFSVSFSPSCMKNEQGETEFFIITFKDITERKQADNKLRQSEEKYKSLVENINVGIFQSTLDGRFIHANSAVIKMAGYESWEQFKELPTKALYTELKDRELFLNTMKEKGYVSNLEVRSLKKDGSEYWISISAVQMKDNDGKIFSFLGSIVDITKRKEAEKLNVESEQRFRMLTDASFEAITIHEKGIMLDANQNMAKLFGYEMNEFIGKSVLDLAAPESRELVMKNVQSGYEGMYEATGLRKDGTTFIAELIGRQIPYNGRTARVTALRDITVRKKVQEELEESHRLYHNLFNSTGTATIIVKKDSTIQLANVECYAVTGYSPAELKGSIWMKYVAPESMGMMKEYFKLRFTKPSEAPRRYETKLVNVKGEIRDVILNIGTIPKDDCIIVSMIDITERKKAEDELKISEEQFRKLFEESPIAKGVTDMEGNLLLFNDAILKITGYTRETIKTIGNIVNTYYNPADRARVVEIARKQNGLHELPLTLKHKDGTPYEALLTLTHMRFQGKDCWQAIIEKSTNRVEKARLN